MERKRDKSQKTESVGHRTSSSGLARSVVDKKGMWSDQIVEHYKCRISIYKPQRRMTRACAGVPGRLQTTHTTCRTNRGSVINKLADGLMGLWIDIISGTEAIDYRGHELISIFILYQLEIHPNL